MSKLFFSFVDELVNKLVKNFTVFPEALFKYSPYRLQKTVMDLEQGNQGFAFLPNTNHNPDNQFHVLYDVTVFLLLSKFEIITDEHTKRI